MKKITLMAVAACMAASASAQNPEVVKSVLAATDYKEAKALVSNASGLTAEESAKAWNKVVDLALEKFNKEQNAQVSGEIMKKDEGFDQKGMYDAALTAVQAALECEKYDQQPNAKGKVKAKFHKPNQDRLSSARMTLINAGQDLYNQKDFGAAYAAFSTYVDCKGNSLYSDYDFSKDQYLGQVAYFASLAAYNSEDYQKASHYASIALGDTAVAKDAMDVKVLAMKSTLKSKEDSVKYQNELKQLYANDPTNDRIFTLLVEYYQGAGDTAARTALVKEQTEKYPTKMAWALKGEGEMREEKWSEAVASYRKSLEIDPEFIQVQFNLALCLNNLAIVSVDQNNGKLSDESKGLLNESIDLLNKIKVKDPNHEVANWPYSLYQAYYLLGDEKNAKIYEDMTK